MGTGTWVVFVYAQMPVPTANQLKFKYLIFNDVRFHTMCKSTKNFGKSFSFGGKSEK